MSHIPAREGMHPRGGTHREYHFPNGYGASVIPDGPGGVEVGVIELSTDKLVYDTPITNDVLRIARIDLSTLLDRIAALPARVSVPARIVESWGHASVADVEGHCMLSVAPGVYYHARRGEIIIVKAELPRGVAPHLPTTV